MSFSFLHLLQPEHPPPGCIRFLKKTEFNCPGGYNWINCMIDAKDRTFKEWLNLVQEYRQPIFPKSNFGFTLTIPEYKAPNIPDPFFHRDLIADLLSSLLVENMQIRWRLRKCLFKWRSRICQKRIIGTEDVVTCSEIPNCWKICVHDIRSRSIYTFHTTTIQKMFVNSLLNQSYAIAMPQTPKNPYTNLPWHLGQILHIVSTIQSKLLENRHRFMDTWLFHYRAAKYCLNKFEKSNNRSLQVNAAKTFFAEPQNLFFLDLFRDTVNDLFDEMGYPRRGHAYNMVIDRILKKDLMDDWDTIVVHSFVHANHRFFPFGSRIKTKSDLEKSVGEVYMKTIRYANSIRLPLGLRTGARVFLSDV